MTIPDTNDCHYDGEPIVLHHGHHGDYAACSVHVSMAIAQYLPASLKDLRSAAESRAGHSLVISTAAEALIILASFDCNI